MSKRLIAVLLTALFVPLIGGLASPAHAAAGDYVGGRGVVYDATLCSGGYGARFKLAMNGTGPGAAATGTWSFACEDPSRSTISGTIECLTVYGAAVGERDAYAGGTVTSSALSSYPVGSTLGFWFIDEASFTSSTTPEDFLGFKAYSSAVPCEQRYVNGAGTFGGELTAGSGGTDIDGDGYLDPVDNCPSTANPGQADVDADDKGDVCDPNGNDGPDGDTDGDGITNYYDYYYWDPCRPNDGGTPDVDGDGHRDGCDTDNNDGPTGDLDGDGVVNREDADNSDGPTGDYDGDGVKNASDNCWRRWNSDQADADADGKGDECDADWNDGPSGDLDGDGVVNSEDADDTDGPAGDSDGDGVTNSTDNCVATANAGQVDADGDGAGDACDADDNDGPAGDLDGDGIVNSDDADDTDGPAGDSDGDGVANGSDNCVGTANAGQDDADGDGTGDACDETPTGSSPPPTCAGQSATIFVRDGVIVGGPDAGQPYAGVLRGTAGNDVIVGTRVKDVVSGGDGNDLVCGLAGYDDLAGEAGNDRLFGDAGNDAITGGSGADTMQGRLGNDVLTGGTQADWFLGGAGTDRATDFSRAQGDRSAGIP